MNKKIIFSSGGTGGHIFPAINLMKYLQKKGYDAVVVTDKKGENFLDKDFKFKYYNLNTSSPLNKNIIKKLFYKINFNFIKRKTRFNYRFWWVCFIPNLFCVNFF